jgi:hypothetical protein
VADALAIIADDNRERKYRGRRGRQWGGISANLTHAHVAREKPPGPAPVEPPPIAAPIPALPPEMIDDRFESFRVVTDYEGLCEAFRDRVEDIHATRLSVDAAGGFALGHASTLLCRPQIKGYGPESLTHMLKATGMVIVLAIDDERFAMVRERLGRRERPLRLPRLPPPTADQNS